MRTKGEGSERQKFDVEKKREREKNRKEEKKEKCQCFEEKIIVKKSQKVERKGEGSFK